MVGRYTIEIEPEIRDWLETLTLPEYAKVEAMADILAERADTLGEPYSRHLSGKTRELRFHLGRSAVRISYWLAGREGGVADGVPEDAAGGAGRGRASDRGTASVRGRARDPRAGD